MKALTAQNGLAYTVNLIFMIPITYEELREFKRLFDPLISYIEKIDDEGVILQFILNINRELKKLGRFKDVPSKTEINNYMPLIYESDIYLKSDIVFLEEVLRKFIGKEMEVKGQVNEEIKTLTKKVKDVLKAPHIQIKNLIINP